MKAKISERGAAAGIDDAVVDAGEDARERRRHAADREDERERLADVDPERGHHRPVLDAGADDQAVARVAQERRQPEEDEHGRRDLERSGRSGCVAPRIVVVSIIQAGTGNWRASKPQIASTSAPRTSASPTVTSTCSIGRW